jgi:N-acyl-D-aspartate/D-glutamate deacylase
MLDWLIEGGTVVDGSGGAPFTADIGVTGGLISHLDTSGRNKPAARERLNAHGAWVTPGFVDIHTHYDGQASWDETFSPSIHHGVSTLMMGNCGVGFAPVRQGHENDLIKLMEGVEDIPGAALAEGIRWGWQSFPQFMDALDAMPHSLDFLAQVPHDPVRMAVMGERAVAQQAATEADIAAMRALVREALQAGAAGFSTGRSDNHRTADGLETPASEASAAELNGIAGAFEGLQHGVVQVVSDFDLLRDPARFDAEFDLVEQLARQSGRPLSMTWLQRDPGGEQWKRMRERVEAATANGLPLYLHTAARGIGVIMGLDASFHPFMGFPGFKQISQLPLAQRAAAMREPARKAQVLKEQPERVSGDGTPIPPLADILLAQIEIISGRMFALASGAEGSPAPDYEPTVQNSFYVRAKQRGCTALEAIYDHLAEGDGSKLIYFPIFNYNEGTLDTVRSMLTHPRALCSLSDAGAHVGTICDASFTTFMLTHWVRDRPTGRLPLEQVVEMMTRRNARYLGLADRGELRAGLRADLNVIDPQRLAVGAPRLVRDLPAGGKRFLQRGEGYLSSFVAGRRVAVNGQLTPERPGRLVRMGQASR